MISRIFRHEKSRMRSWHYTGPIITRLIEELRTPRGDNAATCFYISVLSTLSVIVEWRVEEHIPTILGILFKVGACVAVRGPLTVLIVAVTD